MIKLYKTKYFTQNYFTKGLLILSLLLISSTAFSQLVVSLAKTDNTCPDISAGTITTTVTGGNGAYSYVWSDGPITTANRTGLGKGLYSVIVTDGNGLTGGRNITIVDPPTINILGSSINDVKCNGGNDGSITVSASGGNPGGFTYRWTLGGALISSTSNLINATAGTYSLRVTDSQGCFAIAPFTITQPGVLSFANATKTNNIDFGQTNGAINLNVTGGVTPYSYLWSDGNTSSNRSNLPSGSYSVTVTDANLCTRVYTTDILPLRLLVSTGVKVDNKCFISPSGSITITTIDGVPPYQYKWSDQTSNVVNPDRTGLSAGPYTLTLRDAGGLGATRILPFTITEPALLAFTFTKKNSRCFTDNTGEITVTPTGGVPPYTYLLNGNTVAAPAGVIANLTAGNYTVKVIDANLCESVEQQVAILPVRPLTLTYDMTQVGCANPASGKITTVADGGLAPYTFLWSNGVALPDNDNLILGSYTVTLTDALGCVVSETIAVTAATSPLILVERPGSHINNNCFDDRNGATNIRVSGGVTPYTYVWSDGSNTTNTRTGLPSGTYTVTVTDRVLCTASLIVNITPILPISPGAIVVNTSCAGLNNGSITLNPTGGTGNLNVFWSLDGSTGLSKTGLSSGNYNVAITDANGCQKTFTILVNIATPITAVSTFEPATCNGTGEGAISSKIIGGTPPYTYTWRLQSSIIDLPITRFTTDSIGIAQQPAGVYELMVTDALGCQQVIIETIKPKDCNKENLYITADPLMSPNGDGLGNEFFLINGITSYPANEVIIYNRWGGEVFKINGYNNSDRIFIGEANSGLTNKSESLIDGVYYYTIRTTIDKSLKLNKGFIILKR